MFDYLVGKLPPDVERQHLEFFFAVIVLPGRFVFVKRAEVVVEIQVAEKNSLAESSAAISRMIFVSRSHGRK